MCKENLLIESVEQVQNALVNQTSGMCVNRVPVIKESEELVSMLENDLVNYFGILTVGPGVVVKLFFNGIEIIEVSENNQIVELWDKIEFFDNEGLPNLTPKVLFRGYALTKTTS